MNDATLLQLTHLLWPEGDHPACPKVHWLLDGARDPDIASTLRLGELEYTCLFSGQLHPRLEAAAPYLVRLEPGSAMSGRLLRRGWGKAWGILAVAGPDITLAQLRIHFKKFLRVQTEQGDQLMFRYYDPRVLNVYLPSCTDAECLSFFGPVIRLIAETDEGASLRISELDAGSLRTELQSL